MSRSLNKAILIGNVGQDPDIRSTQNGGRVATFSLATTRTWTGPGGDKQEKTEWHRVAFFGKLAEIAGEYLKKGSQVYVEGRLQTRKWQDKDGADKYTTEIVADRMQMLGSRQGGGSRDMGDAEGASAPRSQGAAAKPTAKSGGKFDDLEDDIPF